MLVIQVFGPAFAVGVLLDVLYESETPNDKREQMLIAAVLLVIVSCVWAAYAVVGLPPIDHATFGVRVIAFFGAIVASGYVISMGAYTASMIRFYMHFM